MTQRRRESSTGHDRPARWPGSGLARRLRLSADVRGRVDLHRPIRVPRAAALAAASPPDAPRRSADRPLRDCSPGDVAGVLVGHTHFDHAVDAPAIARRYGANAYGSASLGPPHATAWPRPPRRGGRSAPRLRAGSVRRALRPQPALEAAVRPQGPHGRRVDLRPPRRPGTRRVQVRRRLRHPHRGRGHRALSPGQRRPQRRRAADGPVDVFLAGVAGRDFTPRYWERILPRLDPRIVVPTHYDNFFSPLGAPQDFVRRVNLGDVPGEVQRVARDATVAAFQRIDA